MPGKVNPTQCEALSMVCTQIMGLEYAVSMANSSGTLQMNEYKPLIGFNILSSLKLLKNAIETGDGPVDAIFKCIKSLYPHDVNLQLYQVHAVTEGTDAQATVSVKIEEKGKTTVGQAADTDTLVASANAYLNALNKMLIKREKKAPSQNIKHQKVKGI